MLLQKSSTYSGKHRKTALDFVASYIWRHSDFVVGAGVGAAIGALITLTLMVCASQ